MRRSLLSLVLIIMMFLASLITSLSANYYCNSPLIKFIGNSAWYNFTCPNDYYYENIPGGVRVHTRSSLFFSVVYRGRVENLRVLNLFCAYRLDPSRCANATTKSLTIAFRIYQSGTTFSKEPSCKMAPIGTGRYKIAPPDRWNYASPIRPTVPVFGISFNDLCSAESVEVPEDTSVVVLTNDGHNYNYPLDGDFWGYEGHFTFDVIEGQ